MKLLAAVKYCTLTPFDTATESGRADERHRRIALSGLASALNKLVTISTGLISVPLTLHYLGAERFGLWMTISSIITMLAFADLGIGNGLLNAISRANGQDDRQAVRQAISSAVLILGGIALLIISAFTLISPWVDWTAVFNVKAPLARTETSQALMVFVTCFAINILAGIIQRVQLGLQLAYIANLWQAAGSLLALASVVMAIQLKLGLPWLVAAMAGTPIVFSALNSYYFFYHSQPDLKPQLSFASRATSRHIAQTGILFLMLQLTASIAFYSDNIIIAKMLGAVVVAQYAIPEKLFSIIPVILSMVLIPLWPAYGEAIGRGDGTWIKKIFIKSIWFSFLFSAVTAFAIDLSASYILKLWVGSDINPPFMLLLGFGIWKICEACGTAISMLLNGGNIVKPQFILASVLLVVSIPLKLLMLKEFGLSGVIWATIIAYTLCVLIPIIFLAPKIFSKFSRSY